MCYKEKYIDKNTKLLTKEGSEVVNSIIMSTQMMAPEENSHRQQNICVAVAKCLGLL